MPLVLLLVEVGRVGLPFVLVAWGRVGRVCLVCRVGRVVLAVPCRDSHVGTAVSCRATVRVRPRSGLSGGNRRV